MARPKTVSEAEPRGQRVVPVVFFSIAEKRAWQEHAKKRGMTLAGLIKSLLAADLSRLPATPGAAGA